MCESNHVTFALPTAGEKTQIKSEAHILTVEDLPGLSHIFSRAVTLASQGFSLAALAN